jgi:hypothetical protein
LSDGEIRGKCDEEESNRGESETHESLYCEDDDDLVTSA